MLIFFNLYFNNDKSDEIKDFFKFLLYSTWRVFFSGLVTKDLFVSYSS